MKSRGLTGNTLDAMKRGLLGTGVRFDKRRNLYYAAYMYQGKNHWLGYYPTKAEALNVRNTAIAAIPYIL
jgi:hypothetical protein